MERSAAVGRGEDEEKAPRGFRKAGRFCRGGASTWRMALMVALTDAVEAEGMTPPERRAREREGARRIGELARRHIERGTPVPAMRDAMWKAYKPEPMRVLARFEAMFDPGSEVAAVELAPLARRLPNGLPPHDRLIAIIQRASRRGVWRSELRMRFPHPRPRMDDLTTMLGEIEQAEMVACATLRLVPHGRYGLRYFHCDYGLPRVVGGGGGVAHCSSDDNDNSKY